MSASVCRCGGPLVSFEWSTWTGQNHRAKPGQAVCTGCGTGCDVTRQEYQRLFQADLNHEETLGTKTAFMNHASKGAPWFG